MKLTPLALFTASFFLLTATAAHAELGAKQLAGPAEEIAQMRAPDAAAGAIHSKSALIPIELSMNKAGRLAWSGSLPVEQPNLQVLLLADSGHGWDFSLRNPAGGLNKAGNLASKIERGEFGMESTRFPSELYSFDGLAKGAWTAEVRAEGTAPRRGFLLIEGDPATELTSYPAHLKFHSQGQIALTAQLSAGRDGRVVLGHAAGSIDEAKITVSRADGRVESVAMFDDGLHADGAAGDGIFGGLFAAGEAGLVNAQVVVKGRNADGVALMRTAEHLIPVVDADLQLGARADGVAAKSGGDSRVSIELAVHTPKSNQHYRAVGEVWGRDATGAPVAIAWIGGMVQPEAGRISLGFDERWVIKSGASGPFELRNLRLEDPDHFVTVAEAKSIPLNLPALRSKASAGEIVIDELMTMGPRPTESVQAKGVGSRLLLVHGYCSGGVWPAGQFSNASTFLDANQNRTHDQFAQRIRDFGATWNSFGTVSHSQGGAASLHLYAFYWSGLDNAVGARRMQSVGTPYQGTNLSGVLAALGGIFGVGCGSNSNMTYSGAASWLAGVPNSARGQANYYTTAFRSTNWWTNDYCNFASDLVLSDPEDGTVERTYGQLPGGINRGHVTGQCHTAGMRDPAQYSDSGRNSVMNSNAAR
jgi:hypothetical protein